MLCRGVRHLDVGTCSHPSHTPPSLPPRFACGLANSVAGAKIADDFFGSIFYSLLPVAFFAIFHFNVIMYIRRRNRYVKKRDEQFAHEEGMRGPRFGLEMQAMMDVLREEPGRLR